MGKLRINVEYSMSFNKDWCDSENRAEHVIDRMRLRGISVENIKEAILKGAKRLRKDGSVVAEYRWYKVVYREFVLQDFKKIYPITVMEL